MKFTHAISMGGALRWHTARQVSLRRPVAASSKPVTRMIPGGQLLNIAFVMDPDLRPD
jgi:hypothetical protein